MSKNAIIPQKAVIFFGHWTKEIYHDAESVKNLGSAFEVRILVFEIEKPKDGEVLFVGALQDKNGISSINGLSSALGQKTVFSKVVPIYSLLERPSKIHNFSFDTNLFIRDRIVNTDILDAPFKKVFQWENASGQKGSLVITSPLFN